MHHHHASPNVVALLLTLVLAVAAGAAPDSSGAADRIDELLSAYHEYGRLNGAALVATGGEVVFAKGFGLANMEWGIPNDVETKFRLGSITKQFTAAVILQLVEEGRLSLDDSVTRHLPDYPAETGDRITIHHLLVHTSGIPSYTGLPAFMEQNSRDPYEPDEFVEVFSGLDLEFEPGSQWRYNNSGYFLLGVIIEKVEGKPYEEIVTEPVFEPLGMHDSGYDRHDTIMAKRAAGYARAGLGYRNAPYLDMSLPYAAGSLYSTVLDLHKWDRALYGVQLLTPHYRDLLWTPHEPVGDNGHYGYGFRIRELPVGDGDHSVGVVEHGGGINGFNTVILRVPEDEHLVVLLNNTGGTSLGAMAEGVVNILYGHDPEMPRPDISRVVLEVVDAEGTAAAVETYRRLKTEEPEAYAFAEGELNAVGYELMRRGELDDAVTVFRLNVEMYPDASNVYDSLGEAYMEIGEHDLAVSNYQKSLELNPRNGNAKTMLAKLGVEVDDDLGQEITLPVEVLERYVGRYELRPDFVLAVTLEDGQLAAQLTGQRKLPIYAMTETQFFPKAVDARITFQVDDDGRAVGLTLEQGERTIDAERLDE